MMSNNYKLHYKSDRCDKGPSSACIGENKRQEQFDGSCAKHRL